MKIVPYSNREPVFITIEVLHEEINVRVSYDKTNKKEDIQLSLKIEQEIKKIFRDYHKTKDGTNKNGAIEI